ncbi:bifunctional pyr operon transcriptional regulator/uracil phosphoribosyltransferase PyrR [Thermoflexibacter ruber]|uniref:Pyrimidine operon attenuation protein / uracil phosphoribosyltransferase n=1 Tax=Thermoflexibacter ruber TaxID=1003 RepID=A0A1I2F1Z6_9BACT|nr:bifunctional pyr operon transcriptional regulator/uracil phosphoribosyltransferase PyrR [Thermoflexibacter ruber]SFE99013.1 pyrimidine operon attenuation protein / uracil phosphoribosyltransferase [Thermoflexibacter ruber]
MEKVLLFDEKSLDITINRLCQQLIENHNDFQDTVLVGMQPRGIFFAERVKKKLDKITEKNIPLGYLDITFHRDDFRRREQPLIPSTTKMPFLVEKKKVILIDDVLFTGRTIRAALSVINEFGRPKQIELLVLVDRKYSRDLPIQPNYVGRSVNTIQSQRVQVEWKEQGTTKDNIWLINEQK